MKLVHSTEQEGVARQYYCSNCGEQVSNDAFYCEECGNEIKKPIKNTFDNQRQIRHRKLKCTGENYYRSETKLKSATKLGKCITCEETTYFEEGFCKKCG